MHYSVSPIAAQMRSHASLRSTGLLLLCYCVSQALSLASFSPSYAPSAGPSYAPSNAPPAQSATSSTLPGGPLSYSPSAPPGAYQPSFSPSPSSNLSAALLPAASASATPSAAAASASPSASATPLYSVVQFLLTLSSSSAAGVTAMGNYLNRDTAAPSTALLAALAARWPGPATAGASATYITPVRYAYEGSQVITPSSVGVFFSLTCTSRRRAAGARPGAPRRALASAASAAQLAAQLASLSADSAGTLSLASDLLAGGSAAGLCTSAAITAISIAGVPAAAPAPAGPPDPLSTPAVQLGIAAGGLFLLAGVGGAVYYLRRRRLEAKQAEDVRKMVAQRAEEEEKKSRRREEEGDAQSEAGEDREREREGEEEGQQQQQQQQRSVRRITNPLSGAVHDEESVWGAAAAGGVLAGSSSSSRGRAASETLPEGWVRMGPNAEGLYWYDHPATCHTQWERPSAAVGPPSSTAMEVAALVWKSGAGELPPHWDHEMDGSGDVYFITPDGKASWEDPRENWLTCECAEQSSSAQARGALLSPTHTHTFPPNRREALSRGGAQGH